MANIVGLFPDGGILEVTVSPSGDDQLTEVEFDPRARSLVFQTTAQLRLQGKLFGDQVVGSAVDLTQSLIVRGGGNNRLSVRGWPGGVSKVYLSGPQGAKCAVAVFPAIFGAGN